MSYKIRARYFIVSDVHDFYRYCKQHYETPHLTNCCQHYRVKFEFIRPSDIRRHQDCNLDSPTEGTQHLYSVQNTANPLELKVRHIPCLCSPCISEDGECLNSQYSDPWRTVKLVPLKGCNLRKYQKRKRPDVEIADAERTKQSENKCDGSDDDLPEICLEYYLRTKKHTKKINTQKEQATRRQKGQYKNCKNLPSVTDAVTDKDICPCTWLNETEEVRVNNIIVHEQEVNEEIEEIDICERGSVEFLMSGSITLPVALNSSTVVDDLFNGDIPDMVFWLSLLSALDNCQDDAAEFQLACQLKEWMPPL